MDKQLNREKLPIYLESLQATDLQTVYETFCLAYYLGVCEAMTTPTLARLLVARPVSDLAADIGPAMQQTAAELAALINAKEVGGG